MSELATLQIKVDASGAIRVVDQFGTSVERTTKKVESLRDAADKVGKKIGTTFAIGLLLAAKETADAQREQAQLAAAIRSTGGAAGQSVDSLNAHAEALRRLTAVTGGQIAETQALLLTFTKIQGEVFPLATQAVLDLAQALGGDVRGAAIQVGKALNDPILGVTALSKAGVQFSAEQKAVIKAFVDTNQIAKAQRVILAELNTQVEGSAAAYRLTLGGALAALRESFLETFDASNWSGIGGLVENLNFVADLIPLIGTRLAIMVENVKNVSAQFDSFFDPILALLPGVKRGDGERRLERSNMDLAAYRELLKQQERDAIGGYVARQSAAGRGVRGLAGGAGTPDPVVIAAAAEAVNKLERNLKAMAKVAEEDTSLREKQDKRTKAALGETAVAVEELSESVRVFQEQTQIALGRFFADFLKSGTQSLGAFWEQFKQLGREAIGNVLAKSVMEKIGKPLGDAAMGAFGALKGAVGGSGLGVIGVVGGVVAGVLSKWSQTSKWEEAAETFNKAARAQEKAAGQLAMAAEQGRAKFLDDFLNYANTETATEREVRSLRNRRNDLGQSAFDLAKAGGGVYSNQLNQLIQQRRFAEAIAVARRDATSFNAPGSLGEKSLLDFAKALEELEKAFQANTKAATDAVKAEQWAAKQRQADSLQQFRDSLNLSAQSPLSPTGQLAEARRQYEVILALAKAGDESAISSLPETARTLLDASRAVNASGARYASDFAAVQADTLGIIEALRTQANEPQDVADGILERIDPWFEEQISIAASSLTVQQVGFQSVVDELVNVRAELSIMKNALKMSLEEVAAAL